MGLADTAHVLGRLALLFAAQQHRRPPIALYIGMRLWRSLLGPPLVVPLRQLRLRRCGLSRCPSFAWGCLGQASSLQFSGALVQIPPTETWPPLRWLGVRSTAADGRARSRLQHVFEPAAGVCMPSYWNFASLTGFALDFPMRARRVGRVCFLMMPRGLGARLLGWLGFLCNLQVWSLCKASSFCVGAGGNFSSSALAVTTPAVLFATGALLCHLMFVFPSW